MKIGREFLLDDIKILQKFVQFVSKYEEDIIVGLGRYQVNGKSLLGLLSLDLSRYVTIFVDSNAIKGTRILDEIEEMLNHEKNDKN